MEFWDPHFHIWDISSKTPSGRPKCSVCSTWKENLRNSDFEKDLDCSGFNLTGGVFVEAVSVCHVEMDGDDYAEHCLPKPSGSQSKLVIQQRDYYCLNLGP